MHGSKIFLPQFLSKKEQRDQAIHCSINFCSHPSVKKNNLMFATFSHKGAAIICAIPIKLIDNHVTRSNAWFIKNINLELIYSQVTLHWIRTLQKSKQSSVIGQGHPT